MAMSATIKHHGVIGDLLLKVVEVTGDNSDKTLTAAELGLKYVVAVWSSGVNDDKRLQFSTYSGTSISVVTAIGSATKQYLFVLGW